MVSAITEADPVVELELNRLQVEPGGQARLTVTVRNPTTVVEGYRLVVLGDPAGDWGEATPPELRIMPQQKGSATIVFSPPRESLALSGIVPFAILAVSAVDPNRSAVVEGDLEVGKVQGLQAKLTPVTSTGRWSGRHIVSLGNWGNTPVRLQMVATDQDQRLGFLVHPEWLDLAVGATATVAVRVRARRPSLRGAEQRLPFHIAAEPDDGLGQRVRPSSLSFSPVSSPGRPVLEGALRQRPILSKAFVTFILLLIAALAGLAWLGLRSTGPIAQPRVDPSVTSPQNVAAAADGPDSITVTWSTTELADSYTLYQIDPLTKAQPKPVTTQKFEDLDRELAVRVVEGLEPETEYCFQLVAVRGDRQSERSAMICTATGVPVASPGISDSATPQPTPTGGTSEPAITTEPPTSSPIVEVPGALAPNEYVVYVSGTPFDPAAEVGVAQKAQSLIESGLDAGYVLTTDYPDWRPHLNPSWVVYVRTGEISRDAALAQCEGLPDSLAVTCTNALFLPGAQAPA